jgi:outer membrane biosynthesis protein TonB
MKLTKGKLSKLFHKKKQTMRRYKNQRKYRRASKTFRQRKPLNLHRSSMKKMVVPRKIEWIGGTEPDEKVPLVVKPASEEAITDPIMEPVADPEPQPLPVSEPASMPEPEPAPEPEPVSIPVPMPEPEPELEPVAEEPVAKPVEEPIAAENVNIEPASTTPSVADALNIIADKIATAVVIKMRESPVTDSYPNQDADLAVPLAVGALVEQTQKPITQTANI